MTDGVKRRKFSFAATAKAGDKQCRKTEAMRRWLNTPEPPLRGPGGLWPARSLRSATLPDLRSHNFCRIFHGEARYRLLRSRRRDQNYADQNKESPQNRSQVKGFAA